MKTLVQIVKQALVSRGDNSSKFDEEVKGDDTFFLPFEDEETRYIFFRI